MGKWMTINTIKTEYIGTEDTHNVYAAELTAIQMAITLFEQKIAEYRNVFIFTDNQSSIKAIEHPRHQSGQYIIKQILDSINRIHDLEPTCIIHLEWVPGHMNIEGNEQADKAAKTAAAASNNTSITTRLRAAQYTSIQTMTNAKWKNEWTTGRETARRLRSISKQPDTTTGPKLYNALQQRKHVTWISRLRTGHCHLNEYLYRFNVIETSHNATSSPIAKQQALPYNSRDGNRDNASSPQCSIGSIKSWNTTPNGSSKSYGSLST